MTEKETEKGREKVISFPSTINSIVDKNIEEIFSKIRFYTYPQYNWQVITVGIEKSLICTIECAVHTYLYSLWV